MKWKRDPGYEYPSDVRLDDFEANHEDEMEDNVNKMQTAENVISEEQEDEEPQPSKSWWSFLLPFNYLH